eukprot:CAMPEP_0197296180 /NCGR_PEP_ID=MMETSP0890-20130614/37669_1 /TAXON_ID=44058 ORGANISM="Aureoumbra lagunensis, Strain CCMP1510" /NCGR_SAMPLE_ID=MMETSP0890 /ASSEMBLY_ACC=CAM_ASM_000533 /LENGTH=69 /DNA_ID=CAMNT_0042772585 /DNA_START=347 /DNA_END=556 /DNA_ORIENTATION=-
MTLGCISREVWPNDKGKTSDPFPDLIWNPKKLPYNPIDNKTDVIAAGWPHLTSQSGNDIDLNIGIHKSA